MNVCFFGIGSIGRRHLKNLNTICKGRHIALNVDVFRNTFNNLGCDVEKLINNQIFDMNKLKSEYDIIFITNPTSMHYDTLKNNIGRAKNFFIEKPIFDKYNNIEKLNLEKNSIYYVACPLRYSKVILRLKEMIENGSNPFSVRVICSSYLPEWRSNIDYRQNYSAKKELGGGVSIDLIHELDYLTNMFGMPNEIIRCIGKYSNLEINSDDLAVYICKYSDKVIEVHLDYFGRTNKREIELYCDDKVIVGDILNNQIFYGKEKITFEEDDNDIYIREMNYFLQCVRKGIKTKNEIDNAQNILKLSREDY